MTEASKGTTLAEALASAIPDESGAHHAVIEFDGYHYLARRMGRGPIGYLMGKEGNSLIMGVVPLVAESLPANWKPLNS